MVNRKIKRNTLPLLMTSERAAEAIGVSKMTVVKYMNEHKLGTGVIGRDGRKAFTALSPDDVMFLSTVVRDGAGRPKVVTA